jgi:tryptophan-rich sensory protein
VYACVVACPATPERLLVLQAVPLTYYSLGLVTQWAWSPLFFRYKRLASGDLMLCHAC